MRNRSIAKPPILNMVKSSNNFKPTVLLNKNILTLTVFFIFDFSHNQSQFMNVHEIALSNIINIFHESFCNKFSKGILQKIVKFSLNIFRSKRRRDRVASTSNGID